MKTWIITLFLVMFSLPALSNDIYIDQIGDTLDLDITQDGSNNEFGDSTTDVTLAGDDMTFAITQTGNTNVIDALIKGANYTGTWTFTGNSNTVDMKCSSASTGKCDDVTVNITTTGDDNAYTVYVGETATADNLVAAFTVTGDHNTITADVDGTSGAVTLVMDNSASLSTNSTDNDEGNAVVVTMDGNGDSNGHTVDLDITGGGSTYNVTQSGTADTTVSATFSGDDQDVDITQSD
jgi:hypothetical protein